MNVPRNSGQLAGWVDTQRQASRLLQNGKPSSLKKDRLEKLEGIGFTFKHLNQCPHVSEPQSDQYYNVQKVDGPISCNVNDEAEAQSPTEHDQSTFVLNNETKKKGGRSWDFLFQELVEYKNVHSHMNVPYMVGQLGKWVRDQRIQFRLLSEGKQSSLTKDRLEQMKRIGFDLQVCAARLPWETRFQELIDFRNVRGHTHVPRSS
jgi:hypothetical protein